MAVNFDNDASILAATTQEPMRDGGFRLVLPGPYVEGEAIFSIASELNADTAQQWCNYVRRVMNERQESKSNPKGNRSRVPEGGGAQEAASSGERGASGKDDDQPVPPSEETLERVLGEAVKNLASKRDDIKETMSKLKEELSHTERALRRACLALEAYGKEE